MDGWKKMRDERRKKGGELLHPETHIFGLNDKASVGTRGTERRNWTDEMKEERQA